MLMKISFISLALTSLTHLWLSYQFGVSLLGFMYGSCAGFFAVSAFITVIQIKEVEK